MELQFSYEEIEKHQRGRGQITLWYLFAFIYLTLFLLNVSTLGFRFVEGSIDVPEATTSFVFSATGLLVSMSLFLWNTHLPRTRHTWVLMIAFSALEALTVFSRAALLFVRREWTFSLCFGVGSVAWLLIARYIWMVLASMDSHRRIKGSAPIIW